MSDISRLMEKITIDENGCWLFAKSVQSNGYGKIWDGSRVVYAHRFSYELHVGKIPKGLDLDHLCRNRSCVNPSHLEPVSRSENLKRGDAGKHLAEEQAQKTHCPRGHPYSGENLVTDGKRRACRVCNKEKYSRYRQKKGASTND